MKRRSSSVRATIKRKSQLNVLFSLRLETERVRQTLQRLDWYQKNGYSPRLPKTSSRKNLLASVKEEFNEREYRKTRGAIIHIWSVIAQAVGLNFKQLGLRL